MASEYDIDDEIILRANYVFGQLDPPVKCTSIDEIEVSYFISMYQYLTGEEIPGSTSMTTQRAKQTICQFMINSIADDILQLPLDHIPAKGVVDKDRRVLRDLLDIFIEMMEASILDNESTTTDEKEVLPPRIRMALEELEVGATEMIDKFLELKKKTTLPLDTKFTQTTPAQFKTSSTSPVTWGKLLSEYKIKDKRTPKPIIGPIKFRKLSLNTQTRSRRRPLGSVSNFPSSHVTNAKQNHVISTKLKKFSPTSSKRKRSESVLRLSCTKSIGRNEQNENIKRALTLVGELERVRNRRQEISKQIKQLQDEDQSLKTLESLMVKELKLSDFMKSRATKKTKHKAVKPKTTGIRRPINLR